MQPERLLKATNLAYPRTNRAGGAAEIIAQHFVPSACLCGLSETGETSA